MKVYVLIKQVPHTETKVKVRSDNNYIDTSDVKWVMNPYDEFAIEEAIQMKEKGKATEVIAISFGPKRVQDTLREALALGADRAVHIDGPEGSDSYLSARALSEALKKEGQVDLILAGKLAIDDDCAQVPQIVAELMNIPHVAVTLKLDVEGAGKASASREIEGAALEKYTLSTPAVISAQKSINGIAQVRYAKVPDILKAKKKEIKEYTMDALGIAASAAKVKNSSFTMPPERKAGRVLKGEPADVAKELVRLLREEAKVI